MANESQNKTSNGNSSRPSVVRTTRNRSVPHPRYSLQQAEKLAKAVFELGPRNCDQDKVAQKAGYKNANNGAYVALRATTTQFGLVVFESSLLSVSEEWIEVFMEDDPQSYKVARQNAMYQPDLYRQLLEDYATSQLPAVDKLALQLHVNQKYGIMKDAASTAASVFYESASYAEMISEKGYIQTIDTDSLPSDTDVASNIEGSNTSGREQSANSSTGRESKSDFEKNLAGLYKVEIPLSNMEMVYIFAPARLPFGEKARLKQFIDLMLEDPPVSSYPQQDRPKDSESGTLDA